MQLIVMITFIGFTRAAIIFSIRKRWEYCILCLFSAIIAIFISMGIRAREKAEINLISKKIESHRIEQKVKVFETELEKERNKRQVEPIDRPNR